MNGNTLEGFQTQIKDVKERAEREGRLKDVKFALNGFVIARETEEEAIRVLQEIQGTANKEAVEAFGDAVKNAGASTSNKTGMWANSKFEDLVQYNDGFKTKLIGTPEQISERIVLLKSLGVNILLGKMPMLLHLLTLSFIAAHADMLQSSRIPALRRGNPAIR
jgi:alkanesulfonate monooxygenase